MLPRLHVLEDRKTWIRGVITTISRVMLGRTWEELEFRLDVLCVMHSTHTEVHEKLMYPLN
jgi:hypothetical protein